MQVPVGYVIAVVTTLAGAVALLFKLYVGAKDQLLAEKEEKVRILTELKRLLEERKKKKGGEHGSF